MQFMNRFHKLSPDRKDVYKKMQKTFIAGKVKMGLFSDSNTVMESDRKVLQSYAKKGYLESGDYCDFHGEERALRMRARNVQYGTRLFGTWRNTASIYKIDESVAPQALASMIPTDTPSDIYMNLPEWAIYMELPSICDISLTYTRRSDNNAKDSDEEITRDIMGFWATHDIITYQGKKYPCLDIFWHGAQSEDIELHEMMLAPFRLILSPDMTVLESFKAGYDLDEESFKELPIRQVLSLLLWLCVEEPDVTNIKGLKMSRKDLKLPRYARNKQSGSFVPPAQETYFEIAKRIGGDIRSWDKQIENENSKGGSLGKRKAPHIRSGHWTGVWIGSGANKTYKPYFQKPLFINAK
ncbi:MAG: hypothetical protein J6N72_05015 [Psychrobacter sp.]|nr:hypothetical protein [Psychrobacter sp.]